ncbi:MAG: hypothetical protein ACLTY8_04990 [Lachnospiraceae bacterium]
MRKFSKKQIGAVGLVVMMSAQGPVMAAEVAQEETASEVSTTEIAEQETERIEDESVEETQVETIVESTEESESESESEEAEIESESALESTESENAELDETAEAAYAEAQAAEIGSAHISCWYQNSNGTWYYYDENGNSVSYKAMTIDGKIYYFGGDGMIASDTYYIDGNWYLADASGARVLTNGWYQKKGYWYYVKEDGSLYTGFLSDGGHTYRLTPIMTVNQPFFCGDYGDEAYAADANGYVSKCADGFYGMPDGGPTYYVSDGKIIRNTWKNIDGNWYYFGENSIMEINGSTKIENKRYYFYSDGIMASNGWIYGISGTWYYAYASGELATGDTWINGTLYHFNEDGSLKTEVNKTENGYTLYGDDGEVIGTIDSEGWNLVDGNYYYLANGSLVKGIDYQTPDGAWYVFDYQGRMVKNKYEWNRWLSEGGWAYTGWILKAGTWYYADLKTAQLYKGFQTVNGVEYYFDETNGAMLVGEKVVDGKIVKTDASGAVTVSEIAADGWSRCDGEYYYYQNGKPYTGWVGAYYVSNGLMLRDTAVVDRSGNQYWVNEYGVYQTNTWVNDGNSYAKADGTLAEDEWLAIGNKTYYFSGTGKMTEDFYLDGCIYVLDEDGGYVLTADLHDGWNLIQDEYYYQAGSRLASGKMEINGSTYYFKDGKMMTNMASKDGVFDGYFDYCYGADGAMLTGAGWKSINGNWYYLNNRSQYIKYWARIDGKMYYFMPGSEYAYEAYWGDINLDEVGIMCTGYRVINHKLYYFDQDGVCQGVCGPKDGWYNANGIWYFMKGGLVSTGMISVNGANYILGLDGKMYTNTVVNSNGLRYVNADGAVVTTQGWLLTSDGYVYIQENGTVCTGVQVIDGVTYYFSANGILIA